MADDFTAKDASGATKTYRAKDLGSSILAPVKVLHDSANAEVLGLVTASPGATTILGRLKTIADAVIGTLTVGTHAVTQSGTWTVGLTDITNAEYETVAASQTDQAMGATGATGDYLAGVLIVPATTSPGAVSIKDGSGSAITIFTGGASSVSNLVPFMVPLGIKSTGGAWKITTGTNVSAMGVGNFT